jgi:tetratricopeptide (TPR) repeat protein
MNKMRTVIFVAATFLAAFAVADIPVTVDVADSAREQLASARRLASAVALAGTGNELEATLRAIAAYRAVEANWPEDVEAVVAAGLAEADLWMQMRSPQSAIPVLERLVPAVTGSDNEPSVFRRLGNAYASSKRDHDAEQAFGRATSSRALERHQVLAVQTLREAALFYERSGRPGKSSALYARLSRLENVHVRSRALAAFDAVRTSLKAGDRGSAREHLGHARKLVESAAAERKDPASEALERELARLTRDLE